LTLAYDGTRLVGWQRQAAGESVQGLLEDALARFEGSPVVVHGAGRTDAGVHALGQVASVALACTHDVETLTRALNAQLPADVRVLRVEEVASGFHARFGARVKTYRYLLGAGGIAWPFDRAFVWHLPESLDFEAAQAGARALVGTHDFAAFQSTGSDAGTTVRTIARSEWLPRDSPAGNRLWAYEIAGDGFLRHMVRAIVGTLVEVGQGRRTVESVAALLAGGTRAQAGATAAPHGLFLVSVEYD